MFDRIEVGSVGREPFDYQPSSLHCDEGPHCSASMRRESVPNDGDLVTVEVGAETFQVVAQELEAEARSLMWSRIVEYSSAAGEFQARTSRTIPVFMLTRQR